MDLSVATQIVDSPVATLVAAVVNSNTTAGNPVRFCALVVAGVMSSPDSRLHDSSSVQAPHRTAAFPTSIWPVEGNERRRCSICKTREESLEEFQAKNWLAERK
jgi:hypothetical protein